MTETTENTAVETTETDETIVETEGVETTTEASGDLDLNEFVDVTDDDASTSTDGAAEGSVDASEGQETPAATQTERVSFADRAEAMGLTVMEGGVYHFSDQFSEVAYANLRTGVGSGIVDDVQVPQLAIFTKAPGTEQDWKQQQFISDSYKFLGNQTLIDQILGSIEAVGSPVFRQRNFMAPNFAEMRHEIIIQNENTIQEVGTVYPMMLITNSYNGTAAASITFGMYIATSEDENDAQAFCTERLGKFKQIHLEGSTTDVSASIGEFVTVFNENIGDVVQGSFEHHITEDDMLKVLDVIQAKGGKKRRELIAAEIAPEEGAEGIETWSMNAWSLFHALTKFSSVETNLNAKRIIENAVESVLVIPEQMFNALRQINGIYVKK